MAQVVADFASLLSEPEVNVVQWVQTALAGARINVSNKERAQGSTGSGSLLDEEEQMDMFDQHATALVLKLQLLSQEVSAKLDEATDTALRKIPRVLHDLELLKKDAQAMKDTVDIARVNLESFEHKTDLSVRSLMELDRVKTRMEDSRRALQEAENWNNLSSEMEQVFAAGDFQKAADKLQEMGRSLPVLKNLPEYESHCDLLGRLQNRFQASLSPQVIMALNERDTTRCQELYKIFKQTDRLEDFRRYYLRSRQVALVQGWSEYKPGPPGASRTKSFLKFLPTFYEEFATALTRELSWAQSLFPSEPAGQVAALMQHALASLEPPLPVTLQGLREGTRSDEQLPAMIQALTASRLFFSRIDDLFKDSLSTTEYQAAVAPVFEPFSMWQRDYGALEKQLLTTQIQTVTLSHSQSLSDNAQHIADVINSWCTIIEAAPDRCIQFTLGFGAIGCIEAIKSAFEVVLEHLQNLLKTVRASAHLVDNTVVTGASFEQDWSLVQGAVRLLSLSLSLLQRIERLWSSLLQKLLPQFPLMRKVLERRSLLTVVSSSSPTTSLLSSSSASLPSSSSGSLSSSTIPSQSISRAQLSLAEALARSLPNDHRAQLMELVLQAEGQVSAPLLGWSIITAHSFDFAQKIQRFLFDTLFHSVRVYLAGLSNLPVWDSNSKASSSGNAPSGGNDPLPVFSLAPSVYITQIGEHLLMLPQQLEPYAEDEALEFSVKSLPYTGTLQSSDNEENVMRGSLDRTERWILAVAYGSVEELINAVLQIKILSEHGRQQLLTDFKYFSNVLSALDISPPPSLLCVTRFLGMTVGELAKVRPSDDEQQYFLKVVSMRGVPLS